MKSQAPPAPQFWGEPPSRWGVCCFATCSSPPCGNTVKRDACPQTWGAGGAFLLLFLLTIAARAASPVTTYRRMAAQLKQDVAQSNGWVKVTAIGASRHGRPLLLAKLADPAAKPADPVRVLVLCRQHGDEPAGTEALLGLVHRAADGDAALRVKLHSVALYVVPMVNPDGAEQGTRVNAAGADLNRDWGPFTQPETRAVRDAAHLIQPQIVLDAHNWDNSDEYNLDCVEGTRAMLSPMGRLTHSVQLGAVQGLRAQGYQVHPTAFGPDADPRLAHRYFTAQGVLSLLVETHSGSPFDAADFVRRQQMYVELIENIAARYADSKERSALARVEPNIGPVRDAALFAAPMSKTASAAAVRAVRGPKNGWLWPLCVFALALWGAGLRPSTFPASGTRTPKGWRQRTVRASAGPKAARPGRPRYQCSQSVPVFRPAAAACARKR